MNYQNVLCLGDSQTFGARTYGCYPLYLAAALTESSRYEWRTINMSANGHTARDLWFGVNTTIGSVSDTYQSCVLIGTNDVGRGTDVDVFGEYYRQVLRALAIVGHHVAFCAEIPPIYSDGHAFFPRECDSRRDVYNDVVRQVVKESNIAVLVPLDVLGPECYVDPVHFNETGNRAVASAFAGAMLGR